MACYDEIHRIARPGEHSQSRITAIVVDGQSTDNAGIEIIRKHYWKRIFATDVRCGESADVKFGAKVGISEAILSEIAGSLELSVPGLKDVLSAKIGESETIAQERVIEFTRKLSPRSCRGLTFAEWQKTEIVVVRRPRRFLFLNLGVLQKCIENPTEEFCPNHFDYPVADCCQDEFKDKLAQGFTHITEAAFGGLTSALLARRVSKKTVELAAVPGVFTLGQKLSSEQFAQFFGKVGLNPTVTSGRLGEELYPARAYMTGSEPVGYNRGLPWGLLLTGIALLSTSIYKVRRDAQSVPLESDRFEQGRALFERGKELAEEAERFFGEASKVSKATHQQRRREVNTESEH